MSTSAKICILYNSRKYFNKLGQVYQAKITSHRMRYYCELQHSGQFKNEEYFYLLEIILIFAMPLRILLEFPQFYLSYFKHYV